MAPDSHMDPDRFRQAWQAHSSRMRVRFDADLLLEIVQRSQKNFRAMILLRDFREVGTALLLIPLWFVLGYSLSLPWTWYLTVPALLWIVAFILVDRVRHPQRPSEPGEPLLVGVQESLRQVEHQIWLLRNILWWYILPCTVAVVPFFVQVTWPARNWGMFFGQVGFVAAVDAFIYLLNQYAVSAQLEPRRQELLALLASLEDETSGEVSGEYPLLTGAQGAPCSRRRVVISSLCFVALLLIVVAGIIAVATSQHPERSPFAAVRWRQSEPEVKVDGEWFKLVALNGLPASEIVAFSQRTHGDLWQKRFEEDLVELLTQMGHPPGDTVTLVVQSLTSSETRTLEDVPMTRANRHAIRAAAQARQRGG